jgi:hypothetical protein
MTAVGIMRIVETAKWQTTLDKAAAEEKVEE